MKLLKQAIAGLQTDEQVESFLLALLTPAEREQLETRLQIVQLLKQGKTQRQIANQLEVGIATVTRGARELKQGRFKHV